MQKNTFDYIIVGAGTAGCVLADRLTEDSETSVLVLEAGGNDDLPAIHNPTDFVQLLHSPVDWGYTTEAEPQLNNRMVYWARGKVLGGSSSINFMGYVRGHRQDYDHWQALGNSGWSYADVLPYFKKAETWEGGASEYRGGDGPLRISRMASVFNPINPLTEAFINAGIELGWPRNDDNNGASQEGFGPFQYTIYQGKRESTAVSYLHSVENRPNLTIQIRALATRILFEGSRAVGVAYLKDGVEQQARANKEVILSGGCVNSPQLLMLSGIGPADHLREMGIQVITDLPGVGRNLHDHPYVGVYFTTKPSFAELSSHITTGLATAFIKTQPELPKPDIQLIFLPCFFPPETGSGYSFLVILTTPQSRGRLTLRSADPTQYPIIHANYLGNIEDLQALIAGIRLAQPVGRAKAYAPFYAADAFPGPQVQSDQAMSEYIRNGLSTMNHPVGTCKMGHDEMAVVDEQLRVRGLEGLRVVDASIMPTISDGNINAAVIMIAEKGADMCKSQH